MDFWGWVEAFTVYMLKWFTFSIQHKLSITVTMAQHWTPTARWWRRKYQGSSPRTTRRIHFNCKFAPSSTNTPFRRLNCFCHFFCTIFSFCLFQITFPFHTQNNTKCYNILSLYHLHYSNTPIKRYTRTFSSL